MIQEVRIRNWKRHTDLRLDFARGINFVVGPNGSGKTAILDAIAFALLGDLSASASYRNLTFHDLMRDKQRDMSIELSFRTSQSNTHQVIRSYSKEANRKQATLRSNGELISKSWDGCTTEIASSFKTSKELLGRIIMLSEGETFEYSTMPPGEGLIGHVEQVLAIDRFADLRDALDILRRKYTREASDWRAILAPFEAGTESRQPEIDDLNSTLSLERSKREGYREEVAKAELSLRKLKEDIVAATERINEVRSLIDAWESTFGIRIKDFNFRGASDAFRMSEGAKLRELEAARDASRDSAAWLEGQIDTQNQILRLIKGLDGEIEGQPDCPVCLRPLTAQMVDEIVSRSEGSIRELSERQELERHKTEEIEESLANYEKRLKSLNDLDAQIARLENNPPGTLDERELKTLLDDYSKKQRDIEDELKVSRSSLEETDGIVGDLERRIGSLEGSRPTGDFTQTYSSAAQTTKAMYLSELFLSAVDDTLAEQRKELLVPLTEPLSKTWSDFLTRKVEVELGGDAQLSVKGEDVEGGLQFPVLSGGEKTALLIFTHIFLSEYFSTCDFMLLDEPLEHLDSRNRWALMRFLVDAAKVGNPKQLIVTTVEEPLIREYVDDDNVQIHVIGSYDQVSA